MSNNDASPSSQLAENAEQNTHMLDSDKNQTLNASLSDDQTQHSQDPGKGAEVDTTPLCVDLDGTLILSDLSFESALRAIKIKPWLILWFPFWLRKGLGYFKSQIARIVRLQYSNIPLNASVLRYIKEKKKAGRPVLLVTGSYQVYARSMAETLGVFDEVMATTVDCNLTGQNKARALVERFGEKGFDYIGNEVKDRHIWQVSRRALLANATPKLIEKLSYINFHRVFHAEETSLRDLFKACQSHKWSKSLLILIAPLIHQAIFKDWNFLLLIAACISFSMVSSATYFFNDLCDLEEDRKHPQKRKRPLARGRIDLKQAVWLMLVLLSGGLAIGMFLSAEFFGALIVYLVLTLSYSLKLKRLVTIDVITLAALYTIRVLAGAFALSLPVSFWLVTFSSFFFFGLALAKRVAELTQLEKRNKRFLFSQHLTVEDKNALSQCGTASSYMALLVLGLSIQSDTSALGNYTNPEMLWLLCPMLLYWTTRMWIKTNRGLLHEGPIVFAARDKSSVGLGLAALAILYLANAI